MDTITTPPGNEPVAKMIEPGSVTATPPISKPVKRGPGRPPKSESPVSAEAATPVPPNAKAPSKRGRPGKRGKEIDVSAVAKQVQGLHQIAALGTGIPELQLTSDESEMLAAAIITVSKEYDLSIDGKTGALLQLAGVGAMIYLPRFAHLKKRVAANKAKLHVVGGTDTDAPAT